MKPIVISSGFKPGLKLRSFCLGVFIVLIGACSNKAALTPEASAELQVHQVDDLFIVDCLLPGQVRRLGTGMTYLTQRRAVKTSAVDCRVRGGEYVAYDRANYATALKIWLPKAQQNDPEAQVYVGEIYEKGYGLEPDYTMAAKWYEKAANQGNSRAQINLGYLYESGLGVEKDLVTALNWYKKASGLETEDLAFASTVESAVRSEYEEEMTLLRNELDRSKKEIADLRARLKATNRQLQQDKNKLKQLQQQLQQSRTQYQYEQKSAQPDEAKLLALKAQLSTREMEVTQQEQKVQLLENELKQQNMFLSNKLIEAENRTSQLNRQLTQQQQQQSQLTQQVSTLQEQLRQSNSELRSMNEKFYAEKTLIEKEQARLTKIKQQQDKDYSSELKQLKQQLQEKDRQLTAGRKKIAELEQAQAEIIKEKEDLTVRYGDAVTDKETALKDLNARLSSQQQALQQQQQTISRLEQEKNTINKEVDQLKDQNKSAENKNTADIKKLETQLSERQQANEQLRKQMLELERERQAFQNKLQEAEVSEVKQVSYAPPKIEILEPPFTVTRSSDLPMIKLRSNVKQREITGRVTAPAGLLRFNVNGRKQAVNDAGVFNAMINLAGDKTEVNTVAIDKRGNKTTLDFMLLSANQQPLSQANRPKTQPINSKPKSYNIDFGPYHALVIGNQNYGKLPRLDTPANDAKAVAKVLSDKYGFKTTLILDADRYTILSELNKLRAKLTEVDNLLIYYAGHGELDRVNLRGHWLPIDAESDNTANWISTIAITDIINAMSARHILVVADSCYSGALTRSSLARLEAGMSDNLRYKWLKVMSKTRSRTVLTSGGLKPVLDSGINGHSIFANAFLEALSSNNGILEGQQLFRNVSDHIQESAQRLNFQQVPEYAPIKHGGHESGDFFFRIRTI